MNIVKVVLFLVIVLISGCSSSSLKEIITSNAIEAVTNKKVSYNGAQCVEIYKHCELDKYEEWLQNGKTACACN
ncbi:MAG: hypothetical protein ACJA0T_000985 [Colwellia sp.]|jgi:hypothetical protein